VILIATAFFLGFLHGLGPDHLMAIATLSVDDRSPQRAIGVAIRFALGHALLLTIGAGLIVLIGWTLPPGVERGGEMLGGALLVVMGLVTLQHLKHHRHSQHSHVQHHQHPQHPGGHHSHLPTMVGAAFAVSSLRALAMLTPFGNRLVAAPLPLLIALIAVFAVGILLSMALFGVVLARVLSTRTLERVGHGAGALIGASSVILGVAWVVTA
jgi:ABC-type nickel/cobalt efflux system permease component RcnA